MSQVTPDGDSLRQAISHAAVLVHTFDAGSDFDAFQKNHDWHGYGTWNAPAGLTERAFTEAEAIAQREYLAVRTLTDASAFRPQATVRCRPIADSGS